MKKLLFLAIILRLLVAAFYFHPDIKTYNFQASFLKKGVFNIYTYLVENKKVLPLKDDFVYFPLTYFVLGGYQMVASPILGAGFDSWVANAQLTTVVRDPNVIRYLLVLKLPYLILDIAIGFLLIQFFENEAPQPYGRGIFSPASSGAKSLRSENASLTHRLTPGVFAKGDKDNKKKAFIFWLFNPFTIILIYVFSNIDIFPVILTLSAFLMVKKQKLFTASFLIGLASGFKLYPLLFVPFLFLAGRNLKEKFLYSLTPIIIFGLISLPFASSAFVQSALVSGLTTGIFKSDFTTLGISLLFFYGALLDKEINLFNYWVALFVLVLSFALFHIQWLLWLAPFIVILVIRNPKLSWTIVLVSVIAFAIPVLYSDRFMTVGLLRVYSSLFDQLPTPYVVLQKFYDPINLQSILHSMMAAGGLVLIYKMFRKEAS